MDHCFLWLRDLDNKKIEAEILGDFRNVVVEENLEDKIEKIPERIGEKRTLLYIFLHRKAKWVGHILRRNRLLHDATERQMTEVKGVGRRTQLLDDLRNRRKYRSKGGR